MVKLLIDILGFIMLIILAKNFLGVFNDSIESLREKLNKKM